MLQQTKNESVTRWVGTVVEVADRECFARVLRLEVPRTILTRGEGALGPDRDRGVESLRAFVKQIEGPDIECPTGEIETGGC